MTANPDIDEKKRPELTFRGVIIGVIITLVFTAANVYAGLKAALTFSTSIPAAVISMAVLRSFRDATIQENNIVQTVASAAGTLSSRSGEHTSELQSPCNLVCRLLLEQ